MITSFFVTKLNTAQTFDKKGNRLVITNLAAPPLKITQLKNQKKHGYWAVQVAVNRSFRELRLTQESRLKIGDQLKLTDVFSPGDKVKITGLSKGRGFSGTTKRWGFATGPRTHGQSDRERAPGSIGQGTDPGRVWPGKKMAGHFGQQTKTIANLKILSIDTQNSLLQVIGTVPGSRHTLLKISKLKVKTKPTVNQNADN